jgi:type I restriction enzyme, S subunit
MSSEWVDTTLGEVCAAQNGAIQTGPFGSQLHASDYVEMGIPVVMPSNIGPDGGISEDGIARIKQEDADRLSQHKLQIGDVVFSRRGDVTRNALIEPHQVGWLCGTGCLKVRLGDERKADAKFISYCLRLPETKEWLIRHAVGATMPNLNTAILSAVPIQIPPISEQKKITNLLRALDDRIALLRETNATLEAIAQALFKSWFVDFDPVHANVGKQTPSLPAEIQALFPSRLVESPQGLIPEGWAYVNLGELVCNQSTTFKFSGIENVVFINTGDVSEGVFLHQNYVPVSGLPGQAKKAIKRDDILFSEIRPKNKRFAYVNIDPQDYVVSTKFMVLRAISEISPRYIYQILKQDSTIDFFNMIAESRSGTFPQITFDSIQNLQVLKPSKACVNQFIDVIAPIIEQIDLNAERNKELANLRDSLLPRLISGQLRLPDAEAAIEEVV